MPSQLQVINRAFVHLGEAVVPYLTGDPKPPNVVKALAAWDECLEVACSRAAWLCCLERATINRSPTLTEDPVNGAAGDWKYDYVFKLPVEALRVFYVDDCGGAFQWEFSRVIQGAFVGRPVIRATTDGPLNVAFVRRTIPELLTPQLARALALELAAQLAGPIQSDAAKAAKFMEQAQQAYLLAMGAEAGGEGGQEPALGSPLSAVRLSAW